MSADEEYAERHARAYADLLAARARNHPEFYTN